MIEIRTSCENCNKQFQANSEEAMIGAFECTFCKECVDSVLQNVCPNCGGGFEKRPTLPKEYLSKYPVSMTKVFRPINLTEFQKRLDKYKNIKPSER